ncbi:hypothetical protein ACWOEH_11795 [Enterococcus nangangensis]
MAGFNHSYNHRPEPSQLGQEFGLDTKVTFVLNGQQQTGKVAKQLANSAVVEIDEDHDNEKLIFRSNGVVVINYKQLQKV